MPINSDGPVTLVVANVPAKVVNELLEVARWHHMSPDAWLRAVIEAALCRHRGVLSPREARSIGGQHIPIMRLGD